MYLLNIRIDSLTKRQALAKAVAFLSDDKQHTIFTPNPEMLVKAHHDNYFKETLNGGDMNVCDGRGLQFFAPEKIERISGADFVVDLCRLAEERGEKVFLLGTGKASTLAKTKENLLARFPKLHIVGVDPGPEILEGEKGRLDVKNNVATIDTIRRQEPSILLVAFGMGKQEKWIRENLKELPSIRIAMGVGGSFDYLSGEVSRAPLLLRKIGLEWAYRLLRQPSRLKRIWNAVVVFPYLVCKNRLSR